MITTLTTGCFHKQGIVNIIKNLMNRQLSEGHKVVLFVAYVFAIYACQLACGVFEEKIYKVPYPSNATPSTSDVFTDNVTPYSFTAAIACLIGYAIIKDEELAFNIPIMKLAKISVCDLIVHIVLITALLRTDYTTLVVVNSTSLLSVVIVGAFFSGVKYADQSSEEREDVALREDRERGMSHERIGGDKVWICSIVFLGVMIFSYFQTPADPTAQNPSGGALITVLLFAVAIFLQGFRPDFVAQVKQEYKPSQIFLFFSINGLLAVLGLIVSLCTWKISYFITFVMQHDRLLVDLTLYGILNAMGALFSYKMIALFRQHIYPMVAEVRRCLTVCVNVAWYGHHLAAMQWVGICIVFTGISIEIAANYNLASKLLPNDAIRNKEGKNYSKIVPKDDWTTRRYEISAAEDVEGI